MTFYQWVKTKSYSGPELSEAFWIQVDDCLGSVLLLLLFVIAVNAMTKVNLG